MAPESLNITFRSNLSTATIERPAAAATVQSKVFLLFPLLFLSNCNENCRCFYTETSVTLSLTSFLLELTAFLWSLASKMGNNIILEEVICFCKENKTQVTSLGFRRWVCNKWSHAVPSNMLLFLYLCLKNIFKQETKILNFPINFAFLFTVLHCK